MQVNLEFRIPVQEKTELVFFRPKKEKFCNFIVSLACGIEFFALWNGWVEGVLNFRSFVQAYHIIVSLSLSFPIIVSLSLSFPICYKEDGFCLT